MAQLEVIQAWTRMFSSMIERYESSKYSNFDVLIRSDDLVNVFIQILALTANQGNARHAGSIISFCNHEKIDQLLN